MIIGKGIISRRAGSNLWRQLPTTLKLANENFFEVHIFLFLLWGVSLLESDSLSSLSSEATIFLSLHDEINFRDYAIISKGHFFKPSSGKKWTKQEEHT